MPPHDPATGLPPIIAAHRGILRRDVDEMQVAQQSCDEKLDVVLDRVAERSGEAGHAAGRLHARRQPAQPTDPGRRRPSRLTIAIVGAVCSAILGPS